MGCFASTIPPVDDDDDAASQLGACGPAAPTHSMTLRGASGSSGHGSNGSQLVRMASSGPLFKGRYSSGDGGGGVRIKRVSSSDTALTSGFATAPSSATLPLLTVDPSRIKPVPSVAAQLTIECSTPSPERAGHSVCVSPRDLALMMSEQVRQAPASSYLQVCYPQLRDGDSHQGGHRLALVRLQGLIPRHHIASKLP